ncbi:hypothetical protein T03_8433 [Trichinella britovi]|uniref:Uncharacterized protein n=1 Tax=Trichinella britovi TaxID=45882 RepID=A0A0V1D933_TRIBR|nr:hypothetical protein T03_8433 [Trichinella britovi]
MYVKLLGSCMVFVRNVKGIRKTSNFVPIKASDISHKCDYLNLLSLTCNDTIAICIISIMSSRAELTFITNAMKLNNITIYVKLLGSCMVFVRNVKGIHKTSNFVKVSAFKWWLHHTKFRRIRRSILLHAQEH